VAWKGRSREQRGVNKGGGLVGVEGARDSEEARTEGAGEGLHFPLPLTLEV